MYNFQSKQDLLFQYRSGLSGEYGAEPQIIVNTRTACVHPRAEVVCSKLSVITGRVSLRFCTVHRKKNSASGNFLRKLASKLRLHLGQFGSGPKLQKSTEGVEDLGFRMCSRRKGCALLSPSLESKSLPEEYKKYVYLYVSVSVYVETFQ